MSLSVLLVCQEEFYFLLYIVFARMTTAAVLRRRPDLLIRKNNNYGSENCGVGEGHVTKSKISVYTLLPKARLVQELLLLVIP